MTVAEGKWFADGREFSRLGRMFPPESFSRDGKGLGDDCILLPGPEGKSWAVSTDSSLEGVHFRLDWCTPREALRKAVLSNLSDINAMGATTQELFWNLGARSDWEESLLEELGRELYTMSQEFGFRIAGGDQVGGARQGFFTFTVMGLLDGRPLLRSHARAGDRVYVSGKLGGSSAGLYLWQQRPELRGSPEWAHVSQALFLPTPPLELGPYLSRTRARVAAIDISDGLSSEAWHLARQSRCGIELQWEALPVAAGLPNLGADSDWESWVLHGGEEYQLLFAGRFDDEQLASMRAVAEVTEIGEVVEEQGVWLRRGSSKMELCSKGWVH